MAKKLRPEQLGVDFNSLPGKPNTLAGYGIINGITTGDTLMPTNPFGGKGLYINSIDNALFAADKKWDVVVTRHLKVYNSESYPKANPNWVEYYTYSTTDNVTVTITNSSLPAQILVFSNNVVCTEVSSNPQGNKQFTYNPTTGVIVFGGAATSVEIFPDYTVPKQLDSPVVEVMSGNNLFNGNYEDGVMVSNDYYLKIRISPSTTSQLSFSSQIGYSYGSIYLSYYYNNIPSGADLRVFNGVDYKPHGIGWKNLNFTNYHSNGTVNVIQSVTDNNNYGRTIMEIIVYGGSNGTHLTQCDWKLNRPRLSTTGATVTKFGRNKLYYDLEFGIKNDVNVTISPNGDITAKKIKKSSGTANDILLADGTTVTKTQLLASYTSTSDLNTQLNNYVTKNGAVTINGTKTFTEAPIVPVPTLSTHAVNKSYVDLELAKKSERDTDEEWYGKKYLSNTFPLVFNDPTEATRRFGFHKPNNRTSVILVPSTEPNDDNWDWTKQIEFKDSGKIKNNGYEIAGSDDNYVPTAGGNQAHKRDLLWSSKYYFRADGGITVIEPKGEVTTVLVWAGADTNTEIQLPLTATNGQKVVLINTADAVWVHVTDTNNITYQKLYNSVGGSSPAKAQMELTFVVDSPANGEGVLTGSGHWYGSYVDEFVII